MKRILLLLFAATICISNVASQVKIKVKNPSNFDRTNEIVEVSLIAIHKKIKLQPGENYVLRNTKGKTIPSQVSYDGKLLFQSGLEARQTVEYSISAEDKIEYPAQAEARAYPERYDDFAWENDRVGFRFYGDALKSVDGPSNGLDIWYKRTDKIVLSEWYAKNQSGEASYHVDHGEGCDPYAVGRTLGAGNMAPFVNDSLWLNTNYLTSQILENGPLRCSFRLTYPYMLVDGQTISESKTISLDAGSQLTKIIQEFSTSKPITVAAGVVKRASNDSVLTSEKDNYFIYQDPPSKDNGLVFIGVLIPQGLDDVFKNSYTYTHTISRKSSEFSNVLGTTTYKPNQPITYYTGFGWTKFGFSTVDEFDTYMREYSEALKKPFRVRVK